MKQEATSMERSIKKQLEELSEGAWFLVMANGDGTFSPISMEKDKSEILKAFTNMLSKEKPFVRNTDVKLKVID